MTADVLEGVTRNGLPWTVRRTFRTVTATVGDRCDVYESGSSDSAQRLHNLLCKGYEAASAPLPEYTYFVAFAHPEGMGNAHVVLASPVTSWAGVDGLKAAVAGFDTEAPLDPADVEIMFFHLLSGPKENAR